MNDHKIAVHWTDEQSANWRRHEINSEGVMTDVPKMSGPITVTISGPLAEWIHDVAADATCVQGHVIEQLLTSGNACGCGSYGGAIALPESPEPYDGPLPGLPF
ncbi:hypothetical protein [Streptomyces sp. NPDC002187]|uniref:hypothetical protein n=1 Tax=Streptomyces sp. NPDC002187 TaxID=3364637 RepID=UPI0036B6C39E